MYTSEALTNEQYHLIIDTLRNGYTDNEGGEHKPNNQVADILVLEANLGCRIGDIVALRKDSFVKSGSIWRLNIIEQKTNKERIFTIPKSVKAFIDEVIVKNYSGDERLFSIQTAAVWKAMRIVTRYLGIENCGTHSLRKMAGQNLMEATGGDVAAVCTFYQHSSIAVTTTYLKRSGAYMENALSKMANLA